MNSVDVESQPATTAAVVCQIVTELDQVRICLDQIQKKLSVFTSGKEGEIKYVEKNSVTLKELKGVLAQVMASGKEGKSEVIKMFNKYGASKLSEVKEEYYLALYQEASEWLNIPF